MMTLYLDECLPSVLLSMRFSKSCFIESSCNASIMMLYCFLSYNFTTNRNHLKEKMISIIVEIPRFFFLRFLRIRFFPHLWDMGFFPFSLVLFRYRTISFIMPKFITSKASYFVHISSFILRTKFSEFSFLPRYGCKGLLPFTLSCISFGFQSCFLYFT